MLSSVEADVSVYAQHPQRPPHVLGPCQGKVHGPSWQCSAVAQSHPASAAPAVRSPPGGPTGHWLQEGQQALIFPIHNCDTYNMYACFYHVIPSVINSKKSTGCLVRARQL